MEISSRSSVTPIIVEVISPPEDLSRRLNSCLFAGLIALLVFGPLAFGAVEPWAVLIQQIGATILMGMWMFKWVHYDAAAPRSNPLYPPLLLLAAIVVTQLVFRTSAYLYATLLATLQATVYFIVFFLCNEVLHKKRGRKIFGRSLAIFGAALALISIIFGFFSPAKMYGLRAPRASGMVYGPYVNHSHYAGLMEMLTPFALVLAFRRNLGRSSRILWGFCALLMGGSIFLSRSRGGMVAITIEIILIAVILSAGDNRRRTRITVVLAVGLLCGFIVWFGSGDVLSRIATLRHPEISAETRLQMAEDGFRMALARPLTGWGLGTFAIVYPAFRSFYTNVFVNAAHDDYIQFLAELGFMGFAAILWFLYRMVKMGRACWSTWSADSASSARVASMLGIAGIASHSFSDFNLQIPGNAALFFALCALLTCGDSGDE